LINQDKIDEWVREVEERPISAPIILRYIATRLKDLAQQNEELRAENFDLRSGNKVEAYESRIANLEYQIELLKRQAVQPAAASISMLVYNQEGQVLRAEIPNADIAADHIAAAFKTAMPGDMSPVRLLMVGPHEELLFVFDSGRTVALPVTGIPSTVSDQMNWEQSFLQEPVGSEKLAVIVPVGRMSLVESVVQSTLRGFVKRMMRNFFESQVAKNYIGTGVKQQPDKACGLVLCVKDQLFLMASREGFLFSMDPERFPFAIEEAMRLRPTDYTVSSFCASREQSIVVVTNNGKVVNREFNWLEPANSFKNKGQTIFSQARRDAGIRVVSAVAASENEWGAALHQDGKITLHKMSDLFAAGSIPAIEADVELIDFAAFHGPVSGQE
jgi:DNA gyrase/topoisomerase IV subunit A